MPYASPKDLPKSVKTRLRGRPAAWRRQWIHVWNNVFAKTGREVDAFKAANSVVTKRIRSGVTETLLGLPSSGGDVDSANRPKISRVIAVRQDPKWIRRKKGNRTDKVESLLRDIDVFIESVDPTRKSLPSARKSAADRMRSLRRGPGRVDNKTARKEGRRTLIRRDVMDRVRKRG